MNADKKIKKIQKRLEFFHRFYDSFDPFTRYMIEHEGETVYISLNNEDGYEITKRKPYILGSKETEIIFAVADSIIVSFSVWKKKRSTRPKYTKRVASEVFIQRGKYSLILSFEIVANGVILFPLKKERK